MDAIRVVIADDHPLYREGVASCLNEDPEIEVVGQSDDADGAVRLALEHAPDIVLLDISMPGGGLNALRNLMTRDQPPRCAMLTVSEQDEDVIAALKTGAVGYLLKGVGARELVSAVKEIASGKSHVSPSLALKMMRGMDQRGAASADPIDDLTKREEDILRGVARGLSNKEIGAALALQEKTIKHYMTAILQKLQVRNRVEAALKAKERWSED